MSLTNGSPALRMLARIAYDGARVAGLPWRADDVLPLPARLTGSRRANARSSRSLYLMALRRHGLLSRDRDGRWLLTPTGFALAIADPNRGGTPRG